MPKTRVLSLLILPGLLLAQPKAQTNSIGMELVLVPAGSFIMGKFQPTCAVTGLQGNVTEAQHEACVKAAEKAARPGFKAEIPRAFYIGKFEVTQEQYQKVTGKNPSYFNQALVGQSTGKYPVNSITWQDAQAFIKKLNAMEKTKAYRLPTEAEWEYAARAGTEDETQGAKKPEVAWYMNNAQYMTHPAGKKAANAWVSYDMLGNVWEWVQDWYDEHVVPAGP
jgi:formylglycine-generating enzyme required for sulfatase activity